MPVMTEVRAAEVAKELQKEIDSGKTLAEILEGLALQPDLTAEYLASLFTTHNVTPEPSTYLTIERAKRADGHTIHAVSGVLPDDVTILECESCAVGIALIGILGGPRQLHNEFLNDDNRDAFDLLAKYSGKSLEWCSGLESGYMHPNYAGDSMESEYMAARTIGKKLRSLVGPHYYED